MATKKHSSSWRLSPVALAILRVLSQKLGVSQAAIIEMGVREIAKREGVKLP